MRRPVRSIVIPGKRGRAGHRQRRGRRRRGDLRRLGPRAARPWRPRDRGTGGVFGAVGFARLLPGDGPHAALRPPRDRAASAASARDELPPRVVESSPISTRRSPNIRRSIRRRSSLAPRASGAGETIQTRFGAYAPSRRLPSEPSVTGSVKKCQDVPSICSPPPHRGCGEPSLGLRRIRQLLQRLRRYAAPVAYYSAPVVYSYSYAAPVTYAASCSPCGYSSYGHAPRRCMS